MSDYIHYIDFDAIRLGDLASELGDYRLAVKSYLRALKRLRKYQGDRMQPIIMASDLTKKIEEISQKGESEKPILKYESWKLSKSSFVKGEQCLKYLFLDKYRKKERTPFSAEKRQLFAQGHFFEDEVRKTEFPDGLNIKEHVGSFAYFNSYTKYLLDISEKLVLYEATIIEDDVLVMCDVLTKDISGLIDIYEIKLNTEINDVIRNDLSVQYLICRKRFGDRLNSFNVILRSEYSDKKWEILDVTSELRENQIETEDKIKYFKSALKKGEPIIPMGEHCNNPYECQFIEYCEKAKIESD